MASGRYGYVMKLKRGRSLLESLFPGLDCNQRFKLGLRSWIDINASRSDDKSAHFWTEYDIYAWAKNDVIMSGYTAVRLNEGANR